MNQETHTTFEGFPFIFGWELTLACNLHCRHCGSSAGAPRLEELTLEEALRVCDQLPSLLTQEVNFTGGEPLLRTDWPVISEKVASLGIRPKFISNGLAITQDMTKKMKDHGVAGVGLSVDGLEKTHDYIRAYDGLYSEVLKSIDRILKAGLPLTVLTTVNSLNIWELPALFRVLEERGVTRWQVQPLFPLGRSLEYREMLLTDETVLRLGSFIKEWDNWAAEAGMEVLPGDSFGYFTGLDPREPPWRGCPAGIVSCGITSDGKVKGCLSLPDECSEGDIRRNDLWDIWFRPDAFRETRAFVPSMLGPNCAGCEKGEQCQGGCSSMSYGGSGRFHNDPWCFKGICNRTGRVC